MSFQSFHRSKNSKVTASKEIFDYKGTRWTWKTDRERLNTVSFPPSQNREQKSLQHTLSTILFESSRSLSISIPLNPVERRLHRWKAAPASRSRRLMTNLNWSIVRDLGGSARGNDRPCVCQWHGCHRCAAWNLLNRFLIVRHVGSRHITQFRRLRFTRPLPLPFVVYFPSERARFCSGIRKTTVTTCLVVLSSYRE